MKALLKSIREFGENNSYSTLDKLILVSIYLSACTIMLSVALAQFFALLVTALSLFRYARNPRIKYSAVDIPFIVFIFIRILSIVFSTDFNVSIQAIYKEVPYYLLFFSISKYGPVLSKKHIQSVLWILFIVAVICSIYGMITVFTGYKVRAESFTSGYYNFGSYLLAALAIILALGKSDMFCNKRYLWIGMIIIISAAIIFTLNRIHIGIMAVMFIIVGIVQERKMLAIMTVIMVAILVFSPAVNQRIEQIIHFTGHLGERDILWKGAMKIWSDHPLLGYGPRTFSQIFPFQSELQDSKIGGWHNDYLQIYIESGALGLLSMLWLIFAIYKEVIIHLKNGYKAGGNKILIISIALSITTIFLSSLTGSALLDVLIRILFGLLLALLVLLMKMEQGIE